MSCCARLPQIPRTGPISTQPEALLPLNPADPQEQQEQQEDLLAAAPPGPEVSHQGTAPHSLPEQQPPGGADASSSQHGAALTPESFASAGTGAGDEEAAAAAQAAIVVGAAATPAAAEGLSAGGGGVEEAKGGEWSEEARGVGTAGLPETGEAIAEGIAQQPGSQSEAEQETGSGVNGGVAVQAGSGEELANGAQGGPATDPESTRQEGNTEPPPPEPPLANGGGAFAPHAAEPSVSGAPPEREGGASGETEGMDASSASPAAGAKSPATSSAVGPIPPAGAGAAAAPVTTAVTEPHLKTAGQPLTHANRAESPTGMSTDLQDKLKALKLRRKHRFVTMRIEGTEVVAETVAAPAEGPAELKVALPYSDCRYAVYDQEIVTADGRKANKLFFFTWLPHNATPHNKVRRERKLLLWCLLVACSTYTAAAAAARCCCCAPTSSYGCGCSVLRAGGRSARM